METTTVETNPVPCLNMPNGVTLCEDMDRKHVWAFNEWMRRYIEEPERYQAEFRTVVAFKKAEDEGREPDYGERCHAYMIHLMAEAPDAG